MLLMNKKKDKPIFIAEVKVKSPFKKIKNNDFWEQLDLAIKYGDYISIHTDPKWGGDFYDLIKAKNYIANNTKKVLAKGIHKTDDEIQQCLDYGADYVLVVDRIPAKKYISKCLLEISDMNVFLKTIEMYPDAKYVYNGRDLKTGKIIPNRYMEFMKRRVHLNSGWLCQASGIKKPDDVIEHSDAFIVGEHLKEFCDCIPDKKSDIEDIKRG